MLKAAPVQPTIPPVALEELSVVAFVQDDATRSILHAGVRPGREIEALNEQPLPTLDSQVNNSSIGLASTSG